MRSLSEPQSVSEQLSAALGTPVTDLRRLSGGASRETWAFHSDGRELILRRDPPGRPSVDGAMRNEADAMRACTAAGLRAPVVVLDGEIGTAGLVMESVPGETLARRILRDDAFAHARTVLVEDIAVFLAGFHALPTSTVPGAAPVDSVARYWDAYRAVGDRSKVFEKTHDWLATHAPAGGTTSLVHGDLRLGNVIVSSSGLAAVIDWELVHVGDPLEDLAWLCVRAWRFGAPGEVAGLASIDDLVAAYERAGGASVDRSALHWWLVAKTLQWGVGCMGQAAVHLTGAVRSVELAAIGRRVAEQEWDLIELLAPTSWSSWRTAPLSTGRADDLSYGRPTARELLDAVHGFLVDDVMPGTTGRLSFHARVAANAVSIVARELAAGPLDRASDDWESLARVTRDKLAVANPRHLAP